MADVLPWTAVYKRKDMISEFQSLVEKATYAELNQMSLILKRTLASKKPDDFERFNVLLEDFVSDDFSSKLKVETLDLIKSLPSPKESKTPVSVWFGPTGYKYNGHQSQEIPRNSYLEKFLKMTNKDIDGADNNSCLINLYTDSSVGIGAHCDDEETISQKHPICNLSIGHEREGILEYKDKRCTRTSAASNSNERSFKLKNNSLQIMTPGCQSIMKHSVPRSEIGGPEELRISYSARHAVLPISENNLVSQKRVFCDAWNTPFGSSLEKKQDPVCIILGDSMLSGLTPDTLNQQNIINITEGGAKIRRVRQLFLEWVELNEHRPIDKVIMSIGANDIRYMAPGRIGSLKRHIVDLISTIRRVSPNVPIFLQSQLPYKLKRGVQCPENEIWKARFYIYNDLLYQVCKQLDISFLNVSSFFLETCWDGYIRLKYELYNTKPWDNVHLSEAGEKLLIDKYSYVISGKLKRHSPYVF